MNAAAREPFPWDEAMHFGIGVLRLAPNDFWAMTPRELAAAAGLSAKRGAPTRAEFADLLKNHPDRTDLNE